MVNAADRLFQLVCLSFVLCYLFIISYQINSTESRYVILFTKEIREIYFFQKDFCHVKR